MSDKLENLTAEMIAAFPEWSGLQITLASERLILLVGPYGRIAYVHAQGDRWIMHRRGTSLSNLHAADGLALVHCLPEVLATRAGASSAAGWLRAHDTWLEALTDEYPTTRRHTGAPSVAALVCPADEEHDTFTAWVPAEALVTFDSDVNIGEVDSTSWRLTGDGASEYSCECGEAATVIREELEVPEERR